MISDSELFLWFRGDQTKRTFTWNWRTWEKETSRNSFPTVNSKRNSSGRKLLSHSDLLKKNLIWIIPFLALMQNRKLNQGFKNLLPDPLYTPKSGFSPSELICVHMELSWKEKLVGIFIISCHFHDSYYNNSILVWLLKKLNLKQDLLYSTANNFSNNEYPVAPMDRLCPLS